MAKITIPSRNRAGLSKLLALSAEAFDDLLNALASQRPKLDLPQRAPEEIKLSGTSKSELDEIISAIVSLSVVRWSRDIPVETFINDVSEAIGVFDSAGTSAESKQRLRKILDLDTLAITSKAITIFTDYQRTLHASKILTDLRYVFKSKPEDEPYGAVIVHLLKLSFHEDTDHKEFFVAMDDNDLRHLKGVIKRAEAKARTIRRKLDAAETVYLGAEMTEEEGD